MDRHVQSLGVADQRRFTDSQRADLIVAADGRCENCRQPLQPGWHADHRHPYVHGGATTLENGQALCPPCNLRKGSQFMEPRQWQQDALLKFLASDPEDFLLVATPGAGKTTFSLLAARELRRSGAISRLIVIVPTAHLRRQWSVAAHRFGFDLDDSFENGTGVLASDYDGVVVTYQAVASKPDLWRLLSEQQATLVALDEVHHGDEEQGAWGTALRAAFAGVRRRLLLSGTPFRTNGNPIPFVRYNSDNKSIASFNYSYGTALRDGVVRPIAVIALDGTASWREAQVAAAISSVTLSEATDAELSRALNSALKPTGSWIDSVLRRADHDLSEKREQVPDAAGLVIAYDQAAAKAIARQLHQISGEAPTIVISEDVRASANIESFAKGSARWIVAVQMVSEGVDIPRLAVGVWASKIRTELFFRQVVGRLVRMRGEDDPLVASLYVPSVQPLLEYGARLNREADAALRLSLKEATAGGPLAEREEVLGPIPLEPSEAVHYATIFGDNSYAEDELHRARELREKHGLAQITDVQIAGLIRDAGTAHAVSHIEVPKPPDVTKREMKDALRRGVAKAVASYAYRSGSEFKDVWKQLNGQVDGVPVDQATVPNLERRLEIIQGWLDDL